MRAEAGGRADETGASDLTRGAQRVARLVSGEMIARVRDGVEPSSARRGWRSTFSSTDPAGAVSRRFSTAEAESPGGCIAARNARPGRGRIASEEPAKSTESLPTGLSSTATRKLSGAGGVSSSAWGIAAPRGKEASYRDSRRRRPTSAGSRRNRVRHSKTTVNGWSGCSLPGQDCCPGPRSWWTRSCSVRAAAGRERSSGWSSSTTGARTGDDAGR